MVPPPPALFAVIINRYFGIPILSSYDDFGAFCPSPYMRGPFHFPSPATVPGPDLNDEKSKFGKKLEFAGLTGDFLQKSPGAAISIYV